MKICWDNLTFLSYNHKYGHFSSYKHNNPFVYKEFCETCGESFLSQKYQNEKFCCISCGQIGKNNIMKNAKTAKKNSINRTGRKSPKLSKKFMKEGNPNWKGGVSFEPYCPVFSDQEWREFIFERDKEKHCWNPQCMNRSKREVLHHINYDKQDCRYSNIIKICNSCNTQANANRSWWKPFYNELMRRRNL